MSAIVAYTCVSQTCLSDLRDSFVSHTRKQPSTSIAASRELDGASTSSLQDLLTDTVRAVERPSSIKTGPIAGGVIGGLFLLVFVIALLCRSQQYRLRVVRSFLHQVLLPLLSLVWYSHRIATVLTSRSRRLGDFDRRWNTTRTHDLEPRVLYQEDVA